MFVILTYDVSVRRTKKILKTCRRYLTHVQRSVFEGMITPAKLERLKAELRKQIVTNEDSIQIYKFDSLKYTLKEQLGKTQQNDNVL